MACSIDGCEKKSHSRGWCKMHYTRWLRHNDPEKLGNSSRHITPQEKILERVEIVTETGCWLWTGTTNDMGYGQLSVNGKLKYAHRISYESFIGDISDGYDVLHKCDVPCCVNPAHLFAGTHRDNMDDMIAKGRHNHGQGHSMAKLTNDDVREIKKALAEFSGYGACANLGRKYGVVRGTIQNIKIGKYWGHIT